MLFESSIFREPTTVRPMKQSSRGDCCNVSKSYFCAFSKKLPPFTTNSQFVVDSFWDAEQLVEECALNL